MLIMNYKKAPANFSAVRNTLYFQIVTVAKTGTLHVQYTHLN